MYMYPPLKKKNSYNIAIFNTFSDAVHIDLLLE